MTRLLDRFMPYLLIAPALIFLAVFFLVPLAEALVVSFRTPAGGFGLQNYARAANDLNFGPALRNTLILVLIAVPLQVALALGMAMMLQKVERGRDLVLWIWTIPLGISDLAAGIVWLSIFTERGYLNSTLMALGIIESPMSLLTYETPLTLFAAVGAGGDLAGNGHRLHHPRLGASSSCRRNMARRPRSSAPTPGHASGASRCRC